MSTTRRSATRLYRLLQLIHYRGSVSRSQLCNLTGNSSFLISKMCDELEASGLIVQMGAGNSSGGRPPALLAVNPQLGTLLGIHFGTINLRIAVTDLQGNVLAFAKTRSHAELGPEASMANCFSVVRGTLDRAGVRKEDLWGVGVGIAGVQDRQAGTLLMWPNVPSWIEVPVKKILLEHFNTAVKVDDITRSMALAERHFGAGRDSADFVYIMAGAGIGAALYLQGRLYAGSRGFAGEFGHLTVQEDGPICSCGNRGCVETLVSASTLIRQARQAAADGRAVQLWRACQGNLDLITAEIIAEAAAQKENYSLTLLHEAGVHLGAGIAGVVNLLNPELVLIGGGLAKAAGAFLLPAVEQTVRQRALKGASQQTSIRLSDLEESDWVRGAALLAAQDALKNLFLSSPAAGGLRSHEIEVSGGGDLRALDLEPAQIVHETPG